MERKIIKKTLSSVLSVLMVLAIVANGGWFSAISAFAASQEEYKIVLRWGSSPSDLDSHITGPLSNGGTFHVSYQNMSQSDNGTTVAALDTDDTSSYGPETITLRPTNSMSRYTYYVYNYSGSGTIQGSSASIELYKNNQLIKTFSPPNSNSSGRTWTVFAVQNGKIYTINTISDKMNATSGTSRSSALSAYKNDVVISPKGRLIAEAEASVINWEKRHNEDLDDVTVKYNSKTEHTADRKPYVIDVGESVTTDLVLSKTDFRDYRIPKKVLESWKTQTVETPVNNSTPQYQHDAYMTQKVKDGKPYISSVFGRSGSNTAYTDVCVSELKVKEGNDYEIRISAGDLNGASCTYYLQQDQTRVVSNSTGVFTPADKLHEKFQRGKKVYAVVKTADGKRSDYEEVKIQPEALTFLQKAQDYLRPGTKFNLLGDDFAKFTVPENLPLIGGAELSFEAFQLPAGFEFDVEEGTLKFSIGANIFEASKEKGDKKYSKEMFKDWKDLTKKSITQAYGESLADKKKAKKQYDTNKDVFLNKWGNGSMPSKSSKNWGVSALGYIEIAFNEYGYVVKEACITVEGEFSFKYNVQASVGFVPVYFYVEAGANFGGTALGVNPVEENIQFNLGSLDWEFTIKLEPKVKAGGGAGVKDFASVGLYAQATLPIIFNFNRKHLTIDLTGEFGVEAEFMLLKGSLTLLDGTVHILDKYWGSRSRSGKSGDSVGAPGEQEVVYSLVDRDYAKNTSAWLSNRHIKMLRAVPERLDISNLQTSIYPNATPQVVAFGDKLLMAWIEDASERDDYNRLRLMYSVYDNGVWSNPAAVLDDGKNDNLPVIVSDGTDVYFAWQKLNNTMSESSGNTFESLMEHIELYTAKYDAATQTIVNAERITDNSCYEYAHQLKMINNTPVLYWASCNDNNPLSSGNNTLHRLALGGQVQTVADNLNYILDLDAAVVNGAEEVSYSTDKDGYYENTDDVTVFTCSGGTVTEFEKANEIACPVVFYGDPQGQTKLFVSDMNNIYCKENGETVAILSENVPVSGNLQFVGDQNNSRIIWTQTEETGNAVYEIELKDGAWTAPVMAGGNGTQLSSVSAVMYQNALSGVCTSAALVYNEETETYEKGATNLCTFNIADSQDIAVEGITLDERDIRKGEAVPFTVLVSNRGFGTTESVEFTVSDGLGTEDVQTVDVELAPGESKTITLNYTAPENYQSTTLSVTGYADGFNDCDTENNTCQKEIGIPHLIISDATVNKVGNEYILTAMVTNESELPVETAVVNLYNGYDNEEVLNFNILADVAPRETHLAEFTIPDTLLTFDSMNTAVVSLNTDEENVTSNKASVVVEKDVTQCAHPETIVERTEPTYVKHGREEIRCSACGELLSSTDLLPLIDISSVNVYGNGQGGFLNNINRNPNENQMTEIQRGVYAITFDQVENNREYAFRFCINHDESKTFTDNSWTTRPTNEVYNAYYNYGNDFRFYLNEQSRVTLIFDAREFDSQTRTGAKYEVITEPIGSTKELRSLTLLDNPTKTDYIAGEKVDLSGMTLVALYSDRTNEFVDYCNVSPLVVTEDTTEITLTYKGMTQSYPVTVTPAVLTDLKLIDPPSQLEYYQGDTVNMKGSAVKVVYNDGAFSELVTDYTISADLSTPGTQTVTLTYNDFSVEFDVVVRKLYITGFWIKTLPTKLEYYRGESFDPTGMELEVNYNSGKREILTDYRVDRFSTDNFGDQYVSLSCDNLNGGRYSASFDIRVIPRLLAITVSRPPAKTSYIKGEQLDIAGMEVYAVMEDGTAHTIPAKATEDEPVAMRTLQFTDNRGWGNNCIMIASNAAGEEETINPYNSYINDYGERVYLYRVPGYVEQVYFTNGYGDYTENTSNLDVAGYWTSSEKGDNGRFILNAWGEPGDGIPAELLDEDEQPIANLDGYTVSMMKDRSGRQDITVEYKDKQAFFFVDLFEKGDVTTDGIVSVTDVTALQKNLVELYDLDDYRMKLADTNGDGVVDIRDATLIQIQLAQ